MADRKHVADEIKLHVEHCIAIRDGARGQPSWTYIQSHLPPVIEQRHVDHADLADDLRPHVQGVACARPFVRHQGRPTVGPYGFVHGVRLHPRLHTHSAARSGGPETLGYAFALWRTWNAEMTSIMPMTMSQQPATKVRTAIESSGETIITPPPMTMIRPENACQPRPGMWSKDSAAASSVIPRNTQLMPIHKARSVTASNLSRKQKKPKTSDTTPLMNVSTLIAAPACVPKAANTYPTPENTK